jgi:hypothetical protein
LETSEVLIKIENRIPNDSAKAKSTNAIHRSSLRTFDFRIFGLLVVGSRYDHENPSVSLISPNGEIQVADDQSCTAKLFKKLTNY